MLKEWALESFERQLRAHRRGAGTTVLQMDGRARHARSGDVVTARNLWIQVARPGDVLFHQV